MNPLMPPERWQRRYTKLRPVGPCWVGIDWSSVMLWSVHAWLIGKDPAQLDACMQHVTARPDDGRPFYPAPEGVDLRRCRCDLRSRLVGEGCQWCNPTAARDGEEE